MSFDERQSPAGVDAGVRAAVRACPFCGAPAAEKFCGACGRNTTAPRRPCGKCGRLSPSSLGVCWNCGAQFHSDMRWKVPLIIFLFVLAFLVSIVIGVVMALAS
jgi:hypothetical protein